MLLNYSIYVVNKVNNMGKWDVPLCVTFSKEKAMMKTLDAIAKEYPLVSQGHYSINLTEFNIIPESTSELLDSCFDDRADIEHAALADYQKADKDNRIQNHYLKFTSDDLKKYFRGGKLK